MHAYSPSYKPAKNIKRNPLSPISPKAILRSSNPLTCLMVGCYIQKGVMLNTNLFLHVPIKSCVFKSANKSTKDRHRSKCPLCAISKKSDYVGHQN